MGDVFFKVCFIYLAVFLYHFKMDCLIGKGAILCSRRLVSSKHVQKQSPNYIAITAALDYSKVLDICWTFLGDKMYSRNSKPFLRASYTTNVDI